MGHVDLMVKFWCIPDGSRAPTHRGLSSEGLASDVFTGSPHVSLHRKLVVHEIGF